MNHLLSFYKDNDEPEKNNDCADDGCKKTPTGCLRHMFVDVVQEIRKDKKPTERPVFLRTHGVLKGTIHFEKEIDEVYKQGFLDPALHDLDTKKPNVYIRYSSDLRRGRPDLNSTIGLGIKIFGIKGKKVIDTIDIGSGKKEKGTSENTMDLLLQNAPNFFVDNSQQMCEFTKAGFEGWSDDWIAQNSPITNDIFADMARFVPSVLATDMWSVMPFRLGVKPGCKDDGREESYNYCKFVVRPGQSTFVGDFDTTNPNYLGAELAARMAAGSASLDLFIQVRPDEATNGKAYLEENFPLDRATVIWDEQVAPLLKVATIKLKKQTIPQKQKDYGDWLAFNIGRVPELNRPVGTIAETRMEVYKYSAEVRHEKNGHPTTEPTILGEPEIVMDYPEPKSRPLTEEEIERITHVRIHPGIGVSRLGNSTDYYIGPEVMHPEPIKPELKGGQYVDGSANSMRDETGALKRQAAKFRVYGYDKDGRVVAEIQESSNTSINWTVHVANKKADWFYFIAAMDLPEYKDLKVKRRNPAVKPKARGSLVIDPGPKSISGINTNDGSYRMTGKFRDVPVSLGELRTDDCGRLIFLPGRGKSGSPTGQPPIDMNDLSTFSNAKDWYDDIADGPVSASVIIGDKKLGGGNVREFDADSAWVISAPPNYAPDIIGWRTMNDMMRNVFMDGGLMELPTRVSFTEHILPILQRLTGLQWVNKGFSSMFGADGPMNFEDTTLLSKLAQNPNGSPRPDTYADLRRTIFNNLRSTNGENEDKSNWPYIYGDTRFTPDSLEGEDISKRNYFLRVPPLFNHYLEKWVAGDFINDYDAEAEKYQKFDDLPLSSQPDMLDQTAMHFCLADAFHPGCEMTWPMRHISMYRAPYRIRGARPQQAEPTYGGTLDSKTVLGFNGPLYTQWPGDITRWMALPWQGDTAFCRAGYDADYSPYAPAYWPARVPNQVFSQADYNIFCDTKKEEAVRLAAFHNRPKWLRHIIEGSVPEVMENMVKQFGELGIIEAREVPEEVKKTFPWIPNFVYVETLTATREKQIEEAMKLFDAVTDSAVFMDPLIAEAGWFSEEQKDEYERIQKRG